MNEKEAKLKMELNRLYGRLAQSNPGVIYADTDSVSEIEIPILLKEGASIPYAMECGDWIDIAIPESVILFKFTPCKIDFGFAMKLPEGYEAHILPRSSTFERYGIILTNSMGIIDNAYCGDNDTWKAMVMPFKNTHIDAGTRLFQFRIMKKQPTIVFKRVEHLSDKDRGGYGSTGV